MKRMVLLLVSASLIAANGEPSMALKGLDPVELAAGREVPGQDKLTADHGHYRYQFATEENRRAFMAQAGRHSVQFGGACMKMGPLSGRGSPERWLVHDGRIYLFASDSCRSSFAANPAAFVDVPDAVPAANDESAAAGAVLMARAVEGMGGAEVLRKMETCAVRFQFTSGAGGKERKSFRTLSMGFPSLFVQWEEHPPDYRYGWMLKDGAGMMSGDETPVEDSVRQHMMREMYRQPLAILKAWQRGEARAVSTGAGELGGSPVDRVAVSVAGATTVLSLDRKTGRILETAWRGRAGAGIHPIVRTYTDFREVGGLTFPFGLKVNVDGKPVTDPLVTVEWVRVNEPVKAEMPAAGK